MQPHIDSNVHSRLQYLENEERVQRLVQENEEQRLHDPLVQRVEKHEKIASLRDPFQKPYDNNQITAGIKEA